MLTLLTATGARPHAWAICERLMRAQDYDGSVRWVIVDDGPEPQPVTFQREGWTLEIVRPQPYWKPGQNTQARNLAAGLAVIPDDARVVVIEDDDWYSPEWLGAVAIAMLISDADLIGESHARYYHVGRRVWRDCGNAEHASLCSTAVRGEALRLLRQIVQRHPKFIDIELWRQFDGLSRLYRTQHCVGIKGLPGRGGIGVGHRMHGTPDPTGRTLRSWIGDDAALYL